MQSKQKIDFEQLRKRVISLDLSIISYQQAIDQVMDFSIKRIPSYVCFSNVHMIIEAQEKESFQKMVNQSTFSFCDGMPLVFAMRFLYGIKQPRIAGMDFMFDILKHGNERRLSVFLYGSTVEIASKLKAFIAEKFPQVKIAGAISPPFRILTNEENENFIGQINESGAQLVLVGLGCPKQETWMAQNSNQIKACLLGVGGAFAIYAGTAKRAPTWLRNVGLEWLYRLGQEPKRLFKRYAITNTKFIILLLKDGFLKRIKA